MSATSSAGSWPKISLVTPSFNQGRYLEETIQSVLTQCYPNLEFVLIDGGSTDESLSIIRRYADRLTYWVSEQDRGQSHAINKGLARCTGEIFNWLNSDDALCPGALHAIAEAWRQHPGCVIAGVEEDIDEHEHRTLTSSQGLTLRHFIHWREAVRNGMRWGQPVTFFPMSAVRRAGGVREDLRYSMDHLLMIEVLKQAEVVYIPHHIARFRVHSQSKTATAGHPRFRQERIRAIRRISSLPVDVPRHELDEDLARTLVGCARLNSREGRHLHAMGNLIEAAWLSRRETWSAMRDFKWPAWASRGSAVPAKS